MVRRFPLACAARGVAEAVAGDRPVVIRDPYRLSGAGLFRNGNGRDVDLHVNAAGSYRHRYALRVSLLDRGRRAAVLYGNDMHLGSGTSGIRVHLKHAELDTHAARLKLEPPYNLRVSLALVEPTIAELNAFMALTDAQRESVLDLRFDPDALARERLDAPGI